MFCTPHGHIHNHIPYVSPTLRLLRHRLLPEEGDEETQHGADDGGADPTHHDAVERNILGEQLIESGRAESCGMKGIRQGEGEREEHGALVDALSPVDEVIEERDDHEDDDQRIDRHEERHGERDDLREADVRRAEAEEDGEEQQPLVRNLLLEDLMEEHRRARCDAAASRQACKRDDDGQEQIARWSEEDSDGRREELPAVF